MARIESLPALEIIRGFRGILDFYVWRGLPCVRKWPTSKGRRPTGAANPQAQTFGVILKAFALVGGEIKTLYDLDAQEQPRTGRDLYVSGALGHLHEADMSDFLDLLTEAVALLTTIETLTHALGSIDTDDLQVDVKSLPVPVRVRGQDQLFSFDAPLGASYTRNIVGENGAIFTDPVPAGQIWVITSLASSALTDSTTEHQYALKIAGTYYEIGKVADVTPPGQFNTLQCFKYLAPDDRVRVTFIGATADAEAIAEVTGFRMTLET